MAAFLGSSNGADGAAGMRRGVVVAGAGSVEPVMQPARAEGEEAEEEAERVLARFSGVTLSWTMGSALGEGAGMLVVTSKRVLWIAEEQGGARGDGDDGAEDGEEEECVARGYAVDVPHIVLHAVTRDAEAFPRPCIYCQLNEENEERSGPREAYLAPADEELLQDMFDTLSQAAALNPDPPDNEDGDGGGMGMMMGGFGGAFISAEDDDADGTGEGTGAIEFSTEQQQMLDRFDGMLQVPADLVHDSNPGARGVEEEEAGQFDNANEDEDNNDPDPTL